MNKQSLTLITSNQILALCARPAAGAFSATKASSGMSNQALPVIRVAGRLSTGLGGGPAAGALLPLAPPMFGGGPATGPPLPLALPISTQCSERDLKNPPEGISAARK